MRPFPLHLTGKRPARTCGHVQVAQPCASCAGFVENIGPHYRHTSMSSQARSVASRHVQVVRACTSCEAMRKLHRLCADCTTMRKLRRLRANCTCRTVQIAQNPVQFAHAGWYSLCVGWCKLHGPVQLAHARTICTDMCNLHMHVQTAHGCAACTFPCILRCWSEVTSC